MSDTSTASVRSPRLETPTTEAVIRRLEQLVGPVEAPLAVALAEIFLAKAPADFVNERGADVLAHLILGAFRFLQRARPDRVDVQVLNPTVEAEGWTAPVTVVRTNLSDRPFIVDTIREYLHAQQLTLEYMVYPSPYIGRDASGAIRAIRAAGPDEPRESLVHVEVAQVEDPGRLEEIRREVGRRLQDVVLATGDFEAMRETVGRVAAELSERARSLPERAHELDEIGEFLVWLRDGAFVFLGYRRYDLVEQGGRLGIAVGPGSGLGVLRNEAVSTYADGVPLESLDPGLRSLVQEGPALIVSKTNAEATVHRRARMDYVGVKKLDARGEVVGEHRFIGLFTSRAYGEDSESVPIVRDKLRRILAESHVTPGSHDYKEIRTIFNSMPKEELFLASTEQIAADVRAVLRSYDTDQVRVAIHEDGLGRGASAMVIIPRDRYSGEVRKRIEQALTRAFRGEVLNFHLALEGGDQARLHFYLGVQPERSEVHAADLEREVRDLTRSWADRVREGLERVRPPDEARRLARRYGEAFSTEYQAASTPAEAVEDILELEAMQVEGRPASVSFSNSADASWVPGDDAVTQLKLYQIGGRLVLSEFMPILENAGMRVIAVNPFEVRGGGLPGAIVYTFAVQDRAGLPLDLERTAAVGETVLAVRAGDLSNDILNGLVLSTGLHWREVDVLRAYSAYAFQLGAVPARFALPSALLKHPQIARMMFELFQVRFDPDRPHSIEERKGAAHDVKAAILAALQGVSLLAEDRALRRLLTLIEATVRTNFHRNGGRTPTRRSGGVPYVSFKFACDQLAAMGKSRLLYEVWVRSSRMEGVHLRGAKVARGGIRWSDRLDDFRTEIMGLVKTQIVKNAVIVPSGSKGGFVLLKPPAEPEKLGEEGKEQYRTLIRGLLDVTDNLDPASGRVSPPERVVAFDEPDPYLVVAADKGTAKFSDVANAISAEYDFWLGDAFASGGSNGYDHKEVGITAKGAWECVRRHFREKGKDIQSEPFTVVGIGDMSGDVFGNGMLLSRSIRLVAAFDHRHVFLDPDPNPERSFAERQRMFGLGRSSWADYDAALLSAGGQIVPRGAKEVALAPSVLAALGLPEDTPPMDGEALIRAVLQAPVELLWNGGIGTYVKAREETHADAGDPTNDAVRVSADQLRAQVVGEGGNLGFTQRARLEYALAGGRINTDALDNSAGVDLSDHEVNLKILLNPGVRSGRMTLEQRNRLLDDLTDEVARLVLKDNVTQSLAVSLDEIRAAEARDDFRDLITALEKAGLLDRASETLPTFEALVERHDAGHSLTRPELCVLLAHAKLWVNAQVLKSPLPDDPVLTGYLVNYFPPVAAAAAGEQLLYAHRLRREIVTTQVSNELVDLMGSEFVMRLTRDTGRPAEDVVRAWVVAARLADHRSALARLTGPEANVSTQGQYLWLLRLGRVLERTARWVLRNVPPDASTERVIETSAKGVAALRAHFPELVEGPDRQLYEARVAEIKLLGADDDLAREMVALRFLDQMLDVLEVAQETGADPVDAAQAFYRISGLLQVPWLRNAIVESARDDRWEQRAAQALIADLGRAHHKLVALVVQSRSGGAALDQAVEKLLQSRSLEVGRFRTLLQEIQGESAMSLSGLSVAVREIARLSDEMSGGAP